MSNKEIFQQATIKKLSGVKFGNAKIQCELGGFTLYHPDHGYLSFGDVNKYGIEYPYSPCGGRKALNGIKESGLLDYDLINWLKPYSTI